MSYSAPNASRSGRESRTNGVALECRGRGEPLLLIHGSGGSRFHWHPVMQRLAERRRVVLVDLPGHGGSLGPPAYVPHTPVGYAVVLAGVLSELGLDRVHVCGHSAGGWTALELAKLGRARSVVAIAPAGLWARRDPWSHTIQLCVQYAMGRAFAPFTPRLMSSERMRALLMRRSFAKPREIPPLAAIELAQTFAATRSLPAHLRETRRERFHGGSDVSVPVTVAWGEEERLIPAKARLRDELPASTRFVTLENCGHMAVWDDADRVAEVILSGTESEHDGEGRSGMWEELA